MTIAIGVSSIMMESRIKLSSFITCLIITLWGMGSQALLAQDTENNESGSEVILTENETPLVFLDCRFCDYDYIRREITFVNYVRDPELANIHVFVTDEETGGGGREYEFSFIGRDIFSGTEFTNTHLINRNATSDEIRQAINGFLSKGLAAFLLQTPSASRITIQYSETDEDRAASFEVDDPWDHWVFEIYAGSIELDLESNQQEFDSRWGVFADRVTENWKIRLRPYFNYTQLEIQQPDRDDTISKRRRHGFDSYALKSVNNHWSIGLFGTYLTENQRNIKHLFNLQPGIEYSLFPYSEATRKSITFSYLIGYSYADYYEETIFGQTEENLLNHQLQAEVNILQPWGNIEGGITGSHYFHDFARRRVEFYGQISVRIIEGLSLSFQSDYNVIQDQLSLPRGEASLEEVLLQQRELATDFEFSGSIAITYTFGSKYSNIVNTRF